MEERIVAKIAATNLPLIATGTRYHTLKVPTIIEDNLEGAHIAVKHLSEKRIPRHRFYRKSAPQHRF